MHDSVYSQHRCLYQNKKHAVFLFKLGQRMLCMKIINLFIPFDLFGDLQWGYVVITTPNGVLDHEEAIKQNVGGQVLGYFH